MSGKPGSGRRPKPVVDRLMELSVPEPNTGCWLWIAKVNHSDYGLMTMAGRKRARLRQAHRVSYEQFIGPIPEGMHIDHKCRQRRCINPEHLEAVTPRENTMRTDNVVAVNARKTVCKNGHEFTPENTYIRPGEHGARSCRKCVNAASVRRNERRRQERAAWI